MQQAGLGDERGNGKREDRTATADSPAKGNHITAKDYFAPEQIPSLRHNYRVPGVVPLFKQRKEMGCWATTGAMLNSWRNKKTTSVDLYVASLGPKFQTLYSTDVGIQRHQMPGLMDAAGLEFEWGASYTTKGLEDLLRKFGPLWFTVLDSSGFGNHAMVVIGLIGTGDMTSTFVVYIDPKDGKEHAKLYPEFMTIYEKVAFEMNEAGEFVEGFQLVHYPK